MASDTTLYEIYEELGVLDIMNSSEVVDFVFQLLAQEDRIEERVAEAEVLELRFDNNDHIAA
ncbi:MAG TPA: hypothetical protein V6C81_28525 [Planktothrix sp.]|jgi:hypothetical protein